MINSRFNLARTPIFLLFLVEGLVIYSAGYVALWLKSGGLDPSEVPFAFRTLLGTIVMLLSLFSMGLYHFHQRAYFHQIFARITVGLLSGVLVLTILAQTVHTPNFTVDIVSIGLLYSFAMLMLVRFLFRKLIDVNVFRRRILVYGAGAAASSIADLRRKADRRGFQIVGHVPAPGDSLSGINQIILKDSKTLLEIARETGAHEIVVAMDDRRGNLPERELLDCKLRGIDIIELLAFHEREVGKIRVDLVNTGWLIFSPGFHISRFRRITKRLSDIVVGGLLLILMLPVIAIVAMAIKIEDGPAAPVIYRQRRSGYHGRMFQVFKFRSMREDAESEGESRWASEDDKRATTVGRFIRKYRLDELPQLSNVLRGQMSLVGPRPERPDFVEQLAQSIPFYVERHSVKPGITGWAQVRYSYAASEQDATEKLQYDLYYVKNHSLLLDLVITLQTVEVILWSKGAR